MQINKELAEERIKNIRYSYSGLSSFETCKLAWYLTYVEKNDREGNFFSDYGTFVHSILEKFFRNELDFWDLKDYYEQNFIANIFHAPPPFPKNMCDTYYLDGLSFFEDFVFDKCKYEVINIEEAVNAKYKDIEMIVKPDLVLKDKETGKYHLYDYKTKKLKGDYTDNAVIEGYKKQFFLYVYFIYQELDIEVDTINIWFIRNKRLVTIKVDPYEISQIVDWVDKVVEKIKKEEEWFPNLDKSNDYFCKFLCSVKEKCEFKNNLT